MDLDLRELIDLNATASPIAHPFTKPSADVILRSSDKVDFKVHKLMLSEASPVFETKFSLPQPSGPEAEASDSPPSETSAIINQLLGFCYLMAHPDFGVGNLDQLAAVLETALKYDISAAVTHLRQHPVRQVVLEEPF
ncbi:hypothetical protein CERSUDRAFT_47695 [Gelatoporia subvermispora B]|uniref:BTB domain-containing protein n=1 Tax=Ceriporiopsis subvermispora (strain B) TaxID=914234 RepID=M2QQB4_CERS8|nr:hypothetical protein CERSUDRAFT_47695 [Gelatoporia subvermispora B]